MQFLRSDPQSRPQPDPRNKADDPPADGFRFLTEQASAGPHRNGGIPCCLE